MTLQSEDMGKLVADGDFEESLARMLFYKRWPGKEWSGGDVSRSYWRRKARAQIADHLRPAHREAKPENDGGGEGLVCANCGTMTPPLSCDCSRHDGTPPRWTTPEGQTEGATVAVPVDVVERAIRWLRRPKNDLNSYAAADDLIAALASKGV